ncbi:MAG: DMT family transporter [Dongiaceae bacterium]
MTRVPLAAAGALVAVAFIWGSMVPLTALLLERLDPLFIGAVRYVLAVPALALLALLGTGRLPFRRRLPWGRIALLGAVGMALFVCCFTFGIRYSDPISAAAILCGIPVVGAIMARLVEGERLPPRVPFAILLAVLGGLFVAFGKPALDGTGGFRGGEFLVLGSMICWSWYSLKTRAWLAPHGMSAAEISFLTTLCGAAVLWLIYLGARLADLSPAPAGWPGAFDWSILGWLGIACTASAIALWNFAVSRINLPVATIYMNLEPVFAVLIGLALGAAASGWQLLGGLVVLAGVLWVQLGDRLLRAGSGRPAPRPEAG